MVTIEIKKNTALVLLAFAAILAGIFVVNAVWTIPSSGVWHEARGVKVTTVSNGETDLQTAITNNWIGSGATCQWSNSYTGEIDLQTLMEDGYTGACYYMRGSEYRVGGFRTEKQTTEASTTTLKCWDPEASRQGNSELGYYYGCK